MAMDATGTDWRQLTRAERDAAYDNGAAVPDHQDIRERRQASSAALRAAHPGSLDIPYGAGARNRIDLFPASESSAPCLVFIHGGYWQGGGRNLVSSVTNGVRAHGWSAAFPGYTLAPDADMRGIVGEVMASLDWLREHAAAHGIGGRLLVAGHSAGGHLAALAAAHPAVVAAMPVSGVFELGPVRDTYLDEKLRLSDADMAEFSPLRRAVVAKPMAIAYGTAELAALLDDSRALHARRAAAHAPGPLLPVARANHFNILDTLEQPDGLLTRALLDLLR